MEKNNDRKRKAYVILETLYIMMVIVMFAAEGSSLYYRVRGIKLELDICLLINFIVFIASIILILVMRFAKMKIRNNSYARLIRVLCVLQACVLIAAIIFMEIKTKNLQRGTSEYRYYGSCFWVTFWPLWSLGLCKDLVVSKSKAVE